MVQVRCGSVDETVRPAPFFQEVAFADAGMIRISALQELFSLWSCCGFGSRRLHRVHFSHRGSNQVALR